MEIKREKDNIANEVYNHIKEMILSGEIRAGQRVPEEGIARMFGVSRTPIREALRRLEVYGLVFVKPRSYAQVIELSDKEIKEIAAVRANLECFAAEILAGQVTKEDCAALHAALQACKTALDMGNVADVFEKDSLLHLEIAKRTQNQYLYEMIERLDAKVQLYRISKCINFKKIESDISEHTGIVRAICDGDAKRAAALMKKHVYSFLHKENI